MNRKITFCFLLLPFLFGFFSPDALEVMQLYRKATAINDLSGTITYTNISKTGRSQTRTLQQHISCNNEAAQTYNLLLEFTDPQDVAGTATLTLQHNKRPDDQWLFLPVLRMSKRISASKRSDRFMGTEMTYEDLSTYLSEPLDEYEYKMLGEENVEGRAAYIIEALPKQGTRTQYSKRKLWIDQETHLMLRTDFYDDKGKLLKVYKAFDIKPVGDSGFFRAYNVEVENVQTGNKTKVAYSDFAINQGVDEQMFSKTYLETQ
jgi:negative regulator of sigma E activity